MQAMEIGILGKTIVMKVKTILYKQAGNAVTED